MADIDNKFIYQQYTSLESMYFKLREIEHINNRANNWELRLQFLETHVIIVIVSGLGWLRIDGQFTELRQGSVYLCMPGQLVEAMVHNFDERGFYYMRFDAIDEVRDSVDQVQMIKSNSPFPFKGEVIVTSPVSVNTLCDSILHYWQEKDPLQSFRGQILFQELLYSILRDVHPNKGNDSETILEYVKGYIEQHYQQELTIDHLAKVANISPRHFMRLFKKRFGCSAIDYLTVYRIEQAQQLMRSGGHNRLRDIARHVGYHDDAYFRRKFKKISGVPPATFMKNSRKKIVAYDFANIGQLIALQINPCAAPADHPWTDYYKRKYDWDAVLPLSSDRLIKREEIQQAGPDYIIGVDVMVSREEQNKLSEIAPAFFVPWEDKDWRTHLRLIGKFIGKEEAAESWLEKYERKVLFVRDQVKHVFKEDSLLILRITTDSFYVLGNRSVGTVFYEDLHVVPVKGIDLWSQNEQITLEQIVSYDPGRLLLIVDEDIHSHTSWQTLCNSKLWGELTAVRNNRVDVLPSYPWIEYTAFTHELMLDEILKVWQDRA